MNSGTDYFNPDYDGQFAYNSSATPLASTWTPPSVDSVWRQVFLSLTQAYERFDIRGMNLSDASNFLRREYEKDVAAGSYVESGAVSADQFPAALRTYIFQLFSLANAGHQTQLSPSQKRALDYLASRDFPVGVNETYYGLGAAGRAGAGAGATSAPLGAPHQNSTGLGLYDNNGAYSACPPPSPNTTTTTTTTVTTNLAREQQALEYGFDSTEEYDRVGSLFPNGEIFWVYEYFYAKSDICYNATFSSDRFAAVTEVGSTTAAATNTSACVNGSNFSANNTCPASNATADFFSNLKTDVLNLDPAVLTNVSAEHVISIRLFHRHAVEGLESPLANSEAPRCIRAR